MADTEKPTVTKRNLVLVDKTASTVTVAWAPAIDNMTTATKIRYYVYQSKASVLTGGAYKTWSVVKKALDITSYTARDLSQYSSVAFRVQAVDEAGNILNYNQIAVSQNGTVTHTAVSNGTTASTSSSGSTSTSSTQSDAARKSAIRQYFSEVRKNDNIQNVMVSSVNNNQLKEFIICQNQALHLSNKVCDINNPRTEFLPINESGIFPGRLVYCNKDLVDGKTPDVQFYANDKQTGKVTVTVNFLSANSQSLSEKNVDATYDSVMGAISKILNRALASGSYPPSNVDTSSEMSNSKEKLAVDLGCSVDYMGAKCKVDTTTTKTQESFYQIENFKQGFYQVSVEAEDRDSVNFLGPGVTLEHLKKAYSYGPIGIIKSVTYGRIGYNLKRYDASSFTFKGDESLSYKQTASVTSKQDIQKNSSAASHYARIWGGSATQAGKTLIAGITAKTDAEGKAVDAAFTKEMTAMMEVSMKNQGVPISYTVTYLASGNEAMTKMTGQYVETEYTPLYNRLSVYLKNDATTLLGTESVNVLIESKYIQLDANGKIIREDWYTEYSKKWNNNSALNTTIQLPANCYFKDNQVYIYLRTRKAAGASWKKASEGWVNIKAGGYLGLKIAGNYINNYLYLAGGDDYCHFV